MPYQRKKTRKIKIGSMFVGGDSPVSVQSMTNTDTKNVTETVAQIRRLTESGCELVRCAVYDTACADAIPDIKKRIDIPLVADIHFDHRLAVAAIKRGADKIRINPGNIGKKDAVLEVVRAAKDFGVPIRVGVNAGSLEKDLLKQYGRPTAEALVKSAERNAGMLFEAGFDDIVVSMKSSSVPDCIQACRMFSGAFDYPLHLGVTEAGTYETALIKASAAIGALLVDGIGDTVRVSVTGRPEQEIAAAKRILQYAGVRRFGLEVVSCPTCARTAIDVMDIAQQVEKKFGHIKKPLTVAVMGCTVNGPGEAKEADIGIAGGKSKSALFIKGEIVRHVDNEAILSALADDIHRIISE